MARTVRLSDIGEKLNVSAVTVSKALSGQKGVGDELREKIIRLADEMGYVRKGTGTEDNVRKSYNIGVVVADRYLKENQSFYWQIYQEISQNALKKSCFAILEVITYQAEKVCENPVLLKEKKADGIIVMGTFRKSYVDMLASVSTVPIVFLDTTVGTPEGDYVVSNNLQGGYRMTNYLFEMGHRRIGYVGTRLATPSIDDRFFGYLKSLMEHGITWKEEWIVDDRDQEYGEMDYEKNFILPKDMPTAFFCNCDISASLIIRKLEEAGYRVPEDVSVVGFDNYVVDQIAKVGITTFEIDTREMSKRAVHIIVNKMKHSRYSTGVFMLPGTFVERDSVKRIGEAVPFVCHR